MIIFTSFFITHGASANMCAEISCEPIHYMPAGCSLMSCYGGGPMDISCTVCQSGYTRIHSGRNAAFSGCEFEAHYCQQNCVGCPDCTSDASWSAHSAGYEKKVNRTCSCNTCNSTTVYRCAAGYYGTSSNGSSGCTKCPNYMGGGNAQSSAGTTQINGCYAPAGAGGSDTTGNRAFDTDCYYSI